MLRGVRIYAQGGAARPPEKLRGVRPVRGAPPETASAYYRSMETLWEMYGFSIAFSLSREGGGENLSIRSHKFSR